MSRSQDSYRRHGTVKVNSKVVPKQTTQNAGVQLTFDRINRLYPAFSGIILSNIPSSVNYYPTTNDN